MESGSAMIKRLYLNDKEINIPWSVSWSFDRRKKADLVLGDKSQKVWAFISVNKKGEEVIKCYTKKTV